MIDPQQAELQRKHQEHQQRLMEQQYEKEKKQREEQAAKAKAEDPNTTGAKIFAMVDEDGSGFLSMDEVITVLRDTGADAEHDEEMLELMDPNGDSIVTLEEWAMVWGHLQSLTSNVDDGAEEDDVDDEEEDDELYEQVVLDDDEDDEDATATMSETEETDNASAAEAGSGSGMRENSEECDAELSATSI